MGVLETTFLAVARALAERGVHFAVAGGLAMALHGAARATDDIDLAVFDADLTALSRTVAEAGFQELTTPMPLAGGRLQLHRFVKLLGSDEEPVVLDVLRFFPGLLPEPAVEVVAYRGQALPVLTRAALIAAKELRLSEQDRADILRLRAP